MRKSMRWSLAFVLAVVWTAATAAPAGAGSGKAGTRDPGVNRKQSDQKARVEQGVRSGEVAKEEPRELREGAVGIRAKEKEFKSDGPLSKDEGQELHQDLNERSQAVYDAKHDGDPRSKADKKDKKKARKVKKDKKHGRERAQERLRENPGQGAGQEKALQNMEPKKGKGE